MDVQVTLSKDKSIELFYNSLCNGLTLLPGYGLELDYSDAEYKESAAKLESPCYEDVLIQMLKDGYKLKILDHEGDGGYNKEIVIQDVYDRVCKTPFPHLVDMLNENDDAITADAILQTVFFNEVIFG